MLLESRKHPTFVGWSSWKCVRFPNQASTGRGWQNVTIGQAYLVVEWSNLLVLYPTTQDNYCYVVAVVLNHPPFHCLFQLSHGWKGPRGEGWLCLKTFRRRFAKSNPPFGIELNPIWLIPLRICCMQHGQTHTLPDDGIFLKCFSMDIVRQPQRKLPRDWYPWLVFSCACVSRFLARIAETIFVVLSRRDEN